MGRPDRGGPSMAQSIEPMRTMWGRHRFARGLTQPDLAREVGVADARISRWRRGQVVPTVQSLQRFSETFGGPRATLDRLAGYPVDAAPSETAMTLADPTVIAARQAFQARFDRLLERRVPPALWAAYLAACEALAETLVASFQAAVAGAKADFDTAQPADPPTPPAPPPGPTGFNR